MQWQKTNLTGVLFLLGFFSLFWILWSISRKTHSQSGLTSRRLNQNQLKIVNAIAKHETANFTSRVWKENNNAFGMKHPVKRVTTSTGADFNNYAIYDSPDASIEDYVLWWDYHTRNGVTKETPEDIVYFMKQKGYFEDSYENYLNGVKRWL